VEVVASLSQGRTTAAQCGLFTHKSVPVLFEPHFTISRNPAGMSHSEFNRVTRPQGLVVSAVDLEVDSSVGGKLRELHII
jgi:hypothetical protein